MVQQYVSTVVIPSVDLRTQGTTQRADLVEEEPGVVLLNVVPSVRVLELCQPAFPLTRQRDTLRQFHYVMGQGVIGMHLHGSVARQRQVEISRHCVSK